MRRKLYDMYVNLNVYREEYTCSDLLKFALQVITCWFDQAAIHIHRLSQNTDDTGQT